MSDIREPQSPIHPHEDKLVLRSLGLMDVVMIGITGMIGGAIFVLTGPAIGLAEVLSFIYLYNTTIRNKYYLSKEEV